MLHKRFGEKERWSCGQFPGGRIYQPVRGPKDVKFQSHAVLVCPYCKQPIEQTSCIGAGPRPSSKHRVSFKHHGPRIHSNFKQTDPNQVKECVYFQSVLFAHVPIIQSCRPCCQRSISAPQSEHVPATHSMQENTMMREREMSAKPARGVNRTNPEPTQKQELGPHTASL